ncbi:MAG: carboxypeptidase regulatory-like domain-containing protein [Chitinophagales bacterium]|nr:carboxypeptidase regulatory-like domain-containing protein [Chitinophagales bacterium]
MIRSEKSSIVQRILWVGFVISVVLGAVYLLATTAHLSAEAINPRLTPAATNADMPSAYPGPKVAFEPAAQANFGQPTMLVTHTTFLKNQTTNEDSFTLDLVAGYDWNATLSPTQTAILSDGEGIPFTVVVEVPTGAAIGDMDSLEVVAVADNQLYTNTTTLDTAFICEPHLNFRGTSAESRDGLNDVYEYAGQRFAYLLIQLYIDPYYYQINATISGYNPDSDSWDVIAEQVSGSAGLLVHQTMIPPTYTKIRVQVDDNYNDSGWVQYDYQFALCREPVVDLHPPVQEAYVQPGKTVVYTQTLTNWAMNSTAFALTATDSAWPITFWHDGNQISETAVLDDLDTFTYTVQIAVPAGIAPGTEDHATVWATDISSPAIQNSASITTHITGDLAYITLYGSNLVVVMDTATNEIIKTIDVGAVHCSNPKHVAITPDGSQVYITCEYSGNVVVIDSNTLTVTHVIDWAYGVSGVAFSRDSQYAFIGNRNLAQILVINTTDYSQQTTITNSAEKLAAHPFEDFIYTASYLGRIYVIDTTDLTVAEIAHTHGEPWDLIVSPNGKWLYVSSIHEEKLTIIDLTTNSIYATLTDLGALSGIDTNPDGTILYVNERNGGVYAIDTDTLEVTMIDAHSTAWALQVTCDSSQLYVGNTQNTISIINTESYEVTNFTLPGFYPEGIAICPQYVGNGVILSPSTQKQQDVPGQTLVYEATLRNETKQTDTFTLTTNTPLWNSELSTTTLGPLTNGEIVTFAVTVTIPTSANWYDTDVIEVTATSITSPTVYSDTAVFISEAYASPQISVAPISLSSTQVVNTNVTDTVTISNGNGVTLTYSVYAVGGDITEASLEDTLDSLNANYQTIINAIPNRYEFSEGETGYFINDGGNDMYDDGNYLLANPDNFIEYANNTIVSEEGFGTNGRYFTRKYPGLFVLAADMKDVNTFGIWGGLGADGSGDVDGSVLQIQHHGTTYYGFVKRVYNAGDPSVNHLIIVASNPMAYHTYSSDTDDDSHSVSNLSTSRRIYYLLYAGDNGYYIDDNETLSIMEAFLNVLPTEVSTSWLTISPTTGTLPTNETQNVTVNFNSTNIQPETYVGTIWVNSNDPINGHLTLPISMTVEPTTNMGWVEGFVTNSRFGTPLQATIIAQGQPYIITSNSDGFYKLWLEAGNYALQVTTHGYVSQTLPVVITAQQATVQNIALVENVPVLDLAPDSIDVIQDAGDITIETMTVNNNGPVTMTFAIGERDTTSGLALLSEYARTTAEMTALQTQLSDANVYSRSFPTVASIPAAAFSELQGTTSLLTWIKYTNYDQEYENTLNAIAQYTTFNLTETDTEDPVVLANLLATANVFLVPSQQTNLGNYFYNLGASWADVLHEFVNQGGTIIITDYCNQAYLLLEGANLIDIQARSCGSGEWFEIVDTQHPLAQGIPSPFYVSGNLGFYTAEDVDVVAKRQNNNGSLVLGKNIGKGHIALIGFYYMPTNNYMARIVANAVQWYDNDISWLTATPITGTVPGYDALDVQITLDTTGLQPGLYTAKIIVNTNDPYTPTQMLPVSMEVQAIASMGQVIGTVSDAWTGNPLRATVQLQGVYTTTADPSYGIWAETGEYTLTTFAAGYMTETVTVVIPAGGVVTQNLALIPAQPRLEGMPESINVTAASGSVTAYNFTLSNTGPQPLDYTWREISPTNPSLFAPMDLSGKNILYDRSHGGAAINYFDEMIQDIIDAGGVITENYTHPVTDMILSQYDVLWVSCCGYTHWTDDELTAVSNWVANGGALFIHSGNSYTTQDLANLFGIEYVPGSYYTGLTSNIHPHPTTDGIDEIYIDSGTEALTSTQAIDILVHDVVNYPIAAAYQYYGGRIVIVTVPIFSDYIINDADNRAFALNIMNWLAAPVYSNVPWTSISPLTGTIPAYDNQNYTLTFDATSLPPGTYNMVMALQQNDPAQDPVLYVPVTLNVITQTVAVSAVPDTTTNTAVPGHTATYHILITNDGNAPDSFTITADGIWDAALSTNTTGELAGGESFMLIVDISVPANATIGSADMTTITVTSDVNPNVSVDVMLTTTADLLRLYLPTVMRP